MSMVALCPDCGRKLATDERLCPYCKQRYEEQDREDDKLADALRRLLARGVLQGILRGEDGE